MLSKQEGLRFPAYIVLVGVSLLLWTLVIVLPRITRRRKP